MPTDIDQNDAFHAHLSKAVSSFMELTGADTVQLFVTVRDSEGHTVSHNHGAGNWYARYGQVKHWILQTEGIDIANAIEDAHDCRE